MGVAFEPNAGIVAEIADERRRQVDGEGWAPDHDDKHTDGEMAVAAACYAMMSATKMAPDWVPMSWPWDRSWWKPKDRRRDLVRAGALIVAEIERLDRAAEGGEANG